MERTVEYTFHLEHWAIRISRCTGEDVIQLSIHWNNKAETNYITDVPLNDFESMVKDLLEKK